MTDLFDLPFEDDEEPVVDSQTSDSRLPTPDSRLSTTELPVAVRRVFTVTELTVRVRDLLETEFFEAPEFGRMRKPKLLPARKMADAIVRGIEREKVDVSYPASLRFPAKLHALFPAMIRRGVASYAKKSLPKPD